MEFPPRKINLISCGPMAHVSDIKLIRTDTTLDLSQKAEKGMSVPASRFAFYNLCPHAYIHFLRCGISEGQQQASSHLPAAHQDARTVFSDQKQEGVCFALAQFLWLTSIYCYIWKLDSNIILRNRRLKQIRETCVGACSELTGEVFSK
ncbi:hypothetical protein OIU85_001377 [Salix viminalis]|uniref:Uncharacterized protein n=1 Tax=Salix viminalis TaxID=40686 RepID=A0A9Q0VLI5_SALVM|nr:hypothetical protein OIU85_001377 [Salix viminalis]